LTVGSDKLGFLYDGKTGDPMGQLSTTNGHTAGIYSCSWSGDSSKVLTASADKTCKIWDGNTGECLKTFTFGDNAPVELQMLGCLWQGDELISIALSGDVYYLDVNAPDKPKKVVRGHNKFITALAYDSQNKHLYSASYDSTIVKWDAQSGATEPMLGKGHGNQINTVCIQGGNLVSCAQDDTVRVTPLSSRQYSDSGVKLGTTPSDIAVGRKDTKLIVAATIDSIDVIKDGKVSKHAVKYQPMTIDISVDELEVAVGGKDNNIYLYSLSGDKLTEKTVLKGHRGPLTAVVYSPDGQHLASSDTNRDIFVWDRKTNQIKIQGWVYHTARVNSLAWSPDSLHIVSGSLDGNIYVWDTQNTTKRVAIKEAHRGGVNVVLWMDDNTVASAGHDCTIKTWSIKY